MSNLIMFYDTETTGLGDFKKAWNDDCQPNLLQLGYKVYDPGSREVVFEIGHLVNTTVHASYKGIDEGAFNAHGITEEMVKKYGTKPHIAARNFVHWADQCSVFVAHNDSYDTRVMQCFMHRAGYSPTVFEGRQKFCTMMSLVPIAQIPNPNGRAGFKWPKLDEAYRKIINPVGFGNAHNALADVNACADLFWWLIDFNHFKFDDGGNIVRS